MILEIKDKFTLENNQPWPMFITAPPGKWLLCYEIEKIEFGGVVVSANGMQVKISALRGPYQAPITVDETGTLKLNWQHTGKITKNEKGEPVRVADSVTILNAHLRRKG